MMPISSQDMLTEEVLPPRIGELLVDAGKLTDIQLGQILKYQHEHACRFGEAAQVLGLLSEEDLNAVLAQQFAFSYLDGTDTHLSPRLYMAFADQLMEKEKIKALRSQLQLSWLSQGHHSLLVGGVDGQEERAVLAGNLAIAFSQLGLRTLLVDANLRGSSLPALLGGEHRIGLSDLLAGRCKASQVISALSGLEDLYFLPSGTRAPNPQELLSRKRMQMLVQDLAHQFDVAIYYAPDQNEWYDAQILASLVGGVILQARRNRTPMPALADMVARLRFIQVRVLGCVYVE